MPDYIEIFDTQLDPDAPITAGLGYQLRNNPEAIADGDSEATRIQYRAMIPDYSYDTGSLGVAAGNTLAEIDMGEVRGVYIELAYFVALNTDSSAGDSDIRFQGSVDNLSFTTLDTIDSSFSAVSSKSFVRPYDYSNESYRYYRVYASGDPDHNISGSIYIKVIGTPNFT